MMHICVDREQEHHIPEVFSCGVDLLEEDKYWVTQGLTVKHVTLFMMIDLVEKDTDPLEVLGTQELQGWEDKLQTPLLVTACVDHKGLMAQ